MFTKFEDNVDVIICLYVDDMLIFGTNLEIKNDTKSFLSSNFDMKDISKVDVILRIKYLEILIVSCFHKDTI